MADIVESAQKEFEKDCEYWRPIYESAREDLYFLSDREDAQWDAQDLRARKQSGRPALTIDQLGQYVNQVVNDIRKNTPTIEVVPDVDGVVEEAEVQQDLIRDIMYNSNSDTCFDIAASYSVKCSIGFIRVDTEYVDDRSFDQQLKVFTVEDPLSCFLDRASTALNGEDAKHCFILDCIDKETFEERYPDKTPVSFTDERTVKPTKDSIVLAEYFYVEEKEREIGITSEGMIEAVQEGVEYTQKRKVKDKSVKRCLLSGQDVLEKTEFVGGFIPLIPVYGNQQWINGEREITSLIRKSKDAQRMFNFWKSLETELLQKQPRAQFLAAEGQVDNFREQWEDPENSPVLYYKSTDIAGNPVNPPSRLNPPEIPTGIVNAARSAVDDIKATIGMYAASLGQASNEVSGIAIQRRNEEGETATYHFSDNLSKSIAHLGKVLVSAIPYVYDTPRFVTVTDKEGKVRPVGVNGAMAPEQERTYYLMDDRGQYKVKVNTGASYTTQRQEAAAFFSDVVMRQPELMSVMGDLLFKNMDFAGAEAMAERMKKFIAPEYRDEKDMLEFDPEKEEMRQIIQQGEQLIQEMQMQIEDLNDELRDKQGELIIKAKEAENKKQSDEESNSIDLMKLEADQRKAEMEYQFKMEALKLKQMEMEARILKERINLDVNIENNNPEEVDIEVQN